MNQYELLYKAGSLTPPSEQTVTEYKKKADKLTAEVSRLLVARPDLERLIGADNQSMMEDNHRNHARFMESLFVAYSAEVFVETVSWVFRAYRAHGFQLTYWPAQLDLWLELLKKELSEDAYREIEPFYRFMLVNQAAFVQLSDATIKHRMNSE